MTGAQAAHDDVDRIRKLRAENLLPAPALDAQEQVRKDRRKLAIPAPIAASQSLKKYNAPPNAVTAPTAMKIKSLVKPIVSPDCRTRRLSDTSGSR